MSQEVEPESGTGPPATGLGTRTLSDPRDMRALAHPIRLALLEVLGVHGPLTATEAGELIGESPSSCSFHLRTLARHNFVEETGLGRGRQRPWRLVQIGMSFSDAMAADPETRIAAEALSQMFLERQLHRLRQWGVRRQAADPDWQDAATHTESMVWLTPDELRVLNADVLEVLMRHLDRLTDPDQRPPDAELVELLYFSYPSSVDTQSDDSSGGVAGDE
jgi:DNA-binding transcriptional ArsR family regulator